MYFIVPSSPTPGHRTLKLVELIQWGHATIMAAAVAGDKNLSATHRRDVTAPAAGSFGHRRAEDFSVSFGAWSKKSSGESSNDP
jgi:hypothetical protein